jgi:hypothetical protein
MRIQNRRELKLDLLLKNAEKHQVHTRTLTCLQDFAKLS